MKWINFSILTALLLLALAGRGDTAAININPNYIGRPVGSTAYEAGNILWATQGYLYWLTVSFHTSALRTVMVFDSTTKPSNGATTRCTGASHANGCLNWCSEGAAQSTDPTESFRSWDWVTHPMLFQNGITVMASTSASGCASLTADGANAWYDAGVQGYP